MIKHIVFWNLKEEAAGGDKIRNGQLIKEKLEGLVGVVPGLLSAQVGVNFNPNGYDLCLCSELASKEALDGYQCHPAHLAVKEFVHQVICERAVVDYEM
ncbi:Dabb family protein [Zongyangia hominis]|uniref:Dabb family protein n=1 Tax=Zongyangia hominis TaxID=2763677 RepID=A0A926I5X8_9FIRM|nr:Dabb family protein [Zongyangia hominis]MBC8569384.1 Dabb family protein [Zongyangia hominis]